LKVARQLKKVAALDAELLLNFSEDGPLLSETAPDIIVLNRNQNSPAKLRYLFKVYLQDGRQKKSCGMPHHMEFRAVLIIFQVHRALRRSIALNNAGLIIKQ